MFSCYGLVDATIRTISPMNISTRLIGNQIGAVTHHHDQSMNPVSLRPMNRRVNNPPNPIPVDFAFDMLNGNF